MFTATLCQMRVFKLADSHCVGAFAIIAGLTKITEFNIGNRDVHLFCHFCCEVFDMGENDVADVASLTTTLLISFCRAGIGIERCRSVLLPNAGEGGVRRKGDRCMRC